MQRRSVIVLVDTNPGSGEDCRATFGCLNLLFQLIRNIFFEKELDQPHGHLMTISNLV